MINNEFEGTSTPLGDVVIAQVMLFVSLNKLPIKWDKDTNVRYVAIRNESYGNTFSPFVQIRAEKNITDPVSRLVQVSECTGFLNKFTVTFIQNPNQHFPVETLVTFTPYEIGAAARSILEFILLGTMLT